MEKKFEIKNPCSENWDKMHPVEGGKFCDRCQHQVYDLSGKSGADIYDLWRQNGGRLCGRIPKAQLDAMNAPRIIPSVERGPRPWVYSAVAVAGLQLAVVSAASSQNLHDTSLPQKEIAATKDKSEVTDSVHEDVIAEAGFDSIERTELTSTEALAEIAPGALTVTIEDDCHLSGTVMIQGGMGGDIFTRANITFEPTIAGMFTPLQSTIPEEAPESFVPVFGSRAYIENEIWWPLKFAASALAFMFALLMFRRKREDENAVPPEKQLF